MAEENDPKRFTPHEYMAAFMGAAYQKQSGERRPPFLTRHVSLWIPKSLEDYNFTQDGEKETLDRDSWVKRIEKFILSIYDTLKKGNENSPSPIETTVTNYLAKSKNKQDKFGLLYNFYPKNPPKIFNESKKDFNEWTKKPIQITGRFRHPTVTINSSWRSIPIEITIELHSEYFTFSTSLDLGYKEFDENGKKIPGLYEGKTYQDVADALKEIYRIAGRRYADAKVELKTDMDEKDRKDLEGSYATLLRSSPAVDPQNPEGIWKLLIDDVFGPAVEASGESEELGRMFGDMRGLVVRRGATPENFIALHHPHEEEGMKKIPTLDDRITGQPFGGFKMYDAKSRMDDIIWHVDALTPFMRADSNPDQNHAGKPENIKPDLSFSTLFGERGIHISLIGLQNPTPEEKRYAPITYITLMSRGETHELARMVDTGNRLNTLRLAAMYGFDKLTKANAVLHKIERQLNKLSGNLHNRLKEVDGAETINDELLEIFDAITACTASVPGGASHRGDRSAYYRSQFQELSKTLNLGKIPGLQNFEEVVSSRIGPLYELILQTKQRSENVAKMINEINEAVQTNQEIKTQKETAKQTARSANFLWFADIFIWLVAFPDYTHNTLPKLLGEDYIKKHFGDHSNFMAALFAVGGVTAFRDELKEAFVFAGKSLLKSIGKAVVATPITAQTVFSFGMELRPEVDPKDLDATAEPQKLLTRNPLPKLLTYTPRPK